MIGSLFRPRIGVLDQALVTMRVWPNDLDLNFHANSGRYVSFMDVGRIDLLVRMRIFRKVIRAGWRPMVGGSILLYRRSLLPLERFTVRSRVIGWDEKWSYFEHVIEKADGQLAASAYVRGVFRSSEGNVSPEEFLALAGQPGLASPPLPDVVSRWREAEALR